MTPVMDQYELVLGLPHTNHAGLAEHLLLMQAGHFHWTSIARAIGVPLSSLRTVAGHEVYATFYFIEERFPDHALTNSFQLDDRLRFVLFLRAFKGIAVESRILFDHDARLREWLAASPATVADRDAETHPFVRFATIFITPEAGNSRLRVASPAGVDFSSIPKLPNDENPYDLTRRAQISGELELLDGGWDLDDPCGEAQDSYAIDIDRDTNGAGLVYFANYVAIMERAERAAILAAHGRFPGVEHAHRLVRARRVAYYGNASTSDSLRTHVRLFPHHQDESAMGFRYEMRRERDGELVCLSETVKVLRDPKRQSQTRKEG